jgi:hypothetical protein
VNSTDGQLTVASNETAENITVTASLAGVGYGTANVTVLIDEKDVPIPANNGISVTSLTATVRKGGTLAFNAYDSPDGAQTLSGVSWQVFGGVMGTIISDGQLKVNLGETAEHLAVKASEDGKYGAAVVTVSPGVIVLGEEEGTLNDPISAGVLRDGNWAWADILSAIKDYNKYVALDLSDWNMHDMTDTVFDPAPGDTDAGESLIVSLVLPDKAKSVTAGTSSGATFRRFTNLKSVKGGGIETVGDYTFYKCEKLETVELSSVKSIGACAFFDTALTSVNLPASLTAITGNPFGGGAVVTITVEQDNPNYTAIDGMLLSRDSQTLIAHPSAVDAVTLDEITNIGAYAFYDCTGLTTLTLPKATSIGAYAFRGCTGLEELNLQGVTYIGDQTFQSTGMGNLTITLGKEAPNLGENIFDSVSDKPVTVKRPRDATGYGEAPFDNDDTTANWGNAFRGLGWTADRGPGSYGNGTVNQSIILKFHDT